MILGAIKKSGEDYLEAIYVLHQRGGPVRSVNVVRYLHFSKSSVSAAVNALQDDGLLRIEPDGTLVLSASGEREAERVYQKHCVLKELLECCGVDTETAERDACQIEHAISAESFEKVQTFYLRFQRELQRCRELVQEESAENGKESSVKKSKNL